MPEKSPIPEPYKFTYITHANDHNTELIISAICEVLGALEIISKQLDKLIKKRS